MATLGNPKETIAILNKYGFNFQKKFGQNFLIDTHVLEKIIRAADITKDDCVLEIGPGIGTMTQYLCENAGKVIAVEIDKNLIPILTEDTLAAYDNVKVINSDVLKLDLKKLAEKTAVVRLRWWQICRITLRHRLLWDCLKREYRWRPLRLWYRRKWRTACRRDRAVKITVPCPLQCSITPSRTLRPMCRRTALCRGRMWARR